LLILISSCVTLFDLGKHLSRAQSNCTAKFQSSSFFEQLSSTASFFDLAE